MSARSFLPLGLMPATMPPARIPGTAVTPPSSHSRSPDAMGYGYRRRLEPRPLAPAAHDVQVLNAVRRAPLTQVVDRRHAHSPASTRVRHHGDVTVVGADDGARRRALARVEDTHEGLSRVELSVDVQQAA